MAANTKNPRKGHPQSKETRRKISEAQKGRKLGEETKAKISKAMRGNQNGKRS